jgi:hypothetical protein
VGSSRDARAAVNCPPPTHPAGSSSITPTSQAMTPTTAHVAQAVPAAAAQNGSDRTPSRKSSTPARATARKPGPAGGSPPSSSHAAPAPSTPWPGTLLLSPMGSKYGSAAELPGECRSSATEIHLYGSGTGARGTGRPARLLGYSCLHRGPAPADCPDTVCGRSGSRHSVTIQRGGPGGDKLSKEAAPPGSWPPEIQLIR